MKLFTPITFRNVELKNRIVMSPMCMYSAEEGVANDFHFVHYGSRAQGGAGLIVVEATGVEPRGRISDKCLGIWNDEQALALKKIVDFVHQNSESKIGIQLAHAGRKGSVSAETNRQMSLEEGWETIAPSPIPFHHSERIPHELSVDEIKTLVEDFRKAAKRAVEAGFDVLEIHGAHGYLIHQFLSPLSNTRTDEYGGSFENRARFLMEIVDAVNSEITENQALFVRISGTEYAENGWEISDSVELSKALKAKNVDLVDVSSGGNINGVTIPLRPGYQVPLAEDVKKNSDVKTGAVGLITSAEQAEEILQNGQGDLIFLAREILRNPYFAVQSSWESGDDCFYPHQYLRAKPAK
ncbi:NADPH dehydrogenase NamA [Epilithonimonas arachidiradicis]|uniref:2,4-dienoyl-CoA reductase-like NADH-dependent reductase (Old Yellow Enzyme family) n=1 Tax=Epilithonimonas arachidiradicis TaxID=1617282 RepID=A0A420DBV0_9FLAO|nr:NADPH dehydrogenase NamA [Epilithonimonas arachidiradicis]RKE88914.1 2,4-dienoyl-CoA reductase-like NADH-dependent reductase (Old Yellow Enzyme family) [Epilithonimonas arachidiradicis]GGG54057.1 oxidoreductase [Epilithonimonas arachidiradicis]